MPKKHPTYKKTANSPKTPVSPISPQRGDSLRSHVQNQTNYIAESILHLRPLRSDPSYSTKHYSSGSKLHRNSYSDPITNVAVGTKTKKHSQSQVQWRLPVKEEQKYSQPVKNKKVTVKKKEQKLKPIIKTNQKTKNAAVTGKSIKKTQNSSQHTRVKKQQPKKKTTQSQPQHQSLFQLYNQYLQHSRNQDSLGRSQKYSQHREYDKHHHFNQQQMFNQHQKSHETKNNAFMSYLKSISPLELNLGLDSRGEKKDFDFDGFFWKVAERRLEANRMLLLEARADLAALRSENQKLRSVLLSTQREGEKYRRKLENEVFRKFMVEDSN